MTTASLAVNPFTLYSKPANPPSIEDLKEARETLYALEAGEVKIKRIKEVFGKFLNLTDLLNSKKEHLFLTSLRDKVQELTFSKKPLTYKERIKSIFFKIYDPTLELQREKEQISRLLLFLSEKTRYEGHSKNLFPHSDLGERLKDKIQEMHTTLDPETGEYLYADFSPEFLNGLSENEKEKRASLMFREEQITTLSERYPKIAEELLNNRPLLKEFIRFCLRSKLSVDVFVRFNHEASLLMENFVDYRLFCDPSLLKIEGSNLQLKIEGQWYSIHGKLKETTHVELLNLFNVEQSLKITIQEIYNEIKEKKAEYTKVEIVPEKGVISWDSGMLGCHYQKENGEIGFQGIDTKNPNWIYSIPAKVLSKEKLAEEFPHWKISEEFLKNKDQKYAFVFAASQKNPDLALLDTHGFCYLVFPDTHRRGKEIPGQFRVIPIGFQPVHMPDSKASKEKGWAYRYFGFLKSVANILHLLSFIEETLPGLVHMPDDSYYAIQRAHSGLCIPISPKQFKKVLGKIQENIWNPDHPHDASPFHILGRNCAFQVNHFATPLFEDFYRSVSEIAAALPLDLKSIPDLSGFISKVHEDQPNITNENLIQEILKQHSDFYINKEIIALVNQMIDQLIDLNKGKEVVELLQSCIRLSNQLAIYEGDKIECEWQDFVKNNICRNLLMNKENSKESLKLIFGLVLEIRDLYKLPLQSSSLAYPIIGSFFEFIKNRCETLRKLLFRFIFFLLGKTRIYQRKTKEGQEIVYSASANRAHNEEQILFHPPQLKRSITDLPIKQWKLKNLLNFIGV